MMIRGSFDNQVTQKGKHKFEFCPLPFFVFSIFKQSINLNSVFPFFRKPYGNKDFSKFSPFLRSPMQLSNDPRIYVSSTNAPLQLFSIWDQNSPIFVDDINLNHFILYIQKLLKITRALKYIRDIFYVSCLGQFDEISDEIFSLANIQIIKKHTAFVI